MARARDARLDTIQAALEEARRQGYPPELEKLVTQLHAKWDNANRLIALFGVVDEASAEEAYQLWREWQAGRGWPLTGGVDPEQPRTLH